ncbi:putative inorganic carbon transporter subunit DabA [Nocardioides sp.]|uniref:putative inorganic carbon transporter subunit DabA n=1 Tax=Nocardioides sp. TaxID=35761 RepID=UPI0035177E78
MNSLRRTAVLLSALAAAGLVGLLALVVRGVATDSWPSSSTTLAVGLVVHVLCLGAVVVRFSATNLRGRDGLGRYTALLGTVLGALVLMVATSELALFALGWTVSGLAVAGLVHGGGTTGAPRAARRTLARLVPGDLALWALVAADAGVLPDLGLGDDLATALGVAALVVAVVSRGALVPLGDWLAETAEAPSPVSALLHAGVVNGGVLLLLLHGSDLPTGTATAAALAAAAALTMVVGVLGQQGRTDVKGRLAASTSTQMALATAFVAVGLPGAALLHVIAHAWWKAWSFLNAGGAVDRAREAHQTRSSALALGVRLGAAAIAGGAAFVVLAHHLPAPVAAVPALLVALVAGATAAAFAAAPSVSHALAGLGAVAALAGLVTIGERLELPEGGAHPASALAAVVTLVGMALAAAAAIPGAREIAPLALLRARLALPPWAVRRRRTTLADHLAPAIRAEHQHVDGGAERIRMAVKIASSPIAPAWPLRSAIAVSPFDGLEHLDADTAAEMLDRLHGRDPRERLHRLLSLYSSGSIAEAHLRRALRDLESDERLPEAWRGLPASDLVAYTRATLAEAPAPAEDAAPDAVGSLGTLGAAARTLAGAQDVASRRRPGAPGSLTEQAAAQAAAWCAQAWQRTAGDADPWRVWLRAARLPGADLALGTPGVRAAARMLPEDPVLALALLHDEARRRATRAGLDPLDLFAYLAGLLATAPGWAAHARWRVDHGQPDSLIALCAVRAVHDLLVADLGEGRGEAVSPGVVAAIGAGDPGTVEVRRLLGLWQRALDLAVGERLLGAGTRPAPVLEDRAVVVQSLGCLDARSAPIRRHLEALGGPRRHRTHGVAGFFGVAVETVDPDGTRVRRAPFLLAPDHRLRASAPRPSAASLLTSAARDPRAVLGWAEVGGLLALGEVAADAARRGLALVPRRRAPELPADGAVDLDVAARAERVAGLLRAAGIADSAEGVGEVLLIVGHGARTANNAYASAYDCGACGANPGAVNAALLAAWFNDPEVRTLLRRDHGITLPLRATALAAWHDTTADVVTLDTDHPDLQGLVEDLARATRRARHEREAELPGGLAAGLRGIDRAEAVPEWGLAGAHGLLLGRGRVTDPGTRWFQLDYDAAQDVDGSRLRAALAGPGLVAAGIMSCYGASVRWPQVHGAGDKTLHNVLGDVGVQRGRDGDLALGLPWQAVAGSAPARGRVWSADTLRHLPARPLIAVEGERDAVLAAVEDVAALHALVRGGWVRLCVVTEGRATELVPRLQAWREVGSDRVVDVVGR